jgi:polysaccharide export outer membrane protein
LTIWQDFCIITTYRLGTIQCERLNGKGTKKTTREEEEISMTKRILLTVTLLFVSMGATGCFSSHPQDIMYFRMPYQVNTSTNTYVLEPPDEIEVMCSQFPRINEQRQKIRPDGKISFEDIGEVTAAGRTPTELAQAIAAKINELYKLSGPNPVDVKVSVFQSKFYYVLGQVNDPGPKLYTGRDTALTAISMADPNPMAWLEKVQVIRPSMNETVRPAVFNLNYKRLMENGDAATNVLLQEGDIIYVPPTVLAWVALKVEEFIRPIARAFSGVYFIRRGVDGGGSYYY